MLEKFTGESRMWILLMVATALLATLLVVTQDLRQAEAGNQLFSPLPCSKGQLKTGCIAQQGVDKEIRFIIDSDEVNSNAPLDYRVQLKGFEADKVEIDLQGKDMYMGELRMKLERGEDGFYRGRGQLPACTTEEMTWRATVWIAQSGEEPTGSWFDFDAK
ncbi:hypothetical protein DV711_06435 [Motiliproteus coralliicola]|uniref:YtkA-like domain-containing protein n=1 Tax=Motiliproteus coralliicola TaxID=2283196 RepID=A0A369WSW6_9GAMM|nr:hypothetical protein [Motiliproteus coralliicola]RDE25190.1 hypothetical protein DV711_06435 [Motiliproteus coralliicola]